MRGNRVPAHPWTLLLLPMIVLGCIREATMTAGELDEAGMAVAQIARAYEAGLNSGDVQSIVDLYAPDGVLMEFATPTDSRGQEAIRASLTALFATNQFSGTTVTSNGVQILGDVAVDNGSTTAMVRENGGDPVERQWKWVSISEKQADGIWKLTRLLVVPIGMVWPPAG